MLNFPCPDCGNTVTSASEICQSCGTQLSPTAFLDYTTQAIQQNPSDPGLYLGRAIYFDSKGEHSRALSNANQAVKLAPELAFAYGTRGMAHLGASEYQDAIFDLNYAIKLDPDDAELYVFRGMAYDEMEQPKEALADFDRALRMDPQSIDAYIRRAAIYDQQGKLGKAVSDLKRALEVTTDPYQRAQIEDLLAQETKFHSQASQQRAGNFLVTILRVLVTMVVEFVRVIVKAVFSG